MGNVQALIDKVFARMDHAKDPTQADWSRAFAAAEARQFAADAEVAQTTAPEGEQS